MKREVLDAVPFFGLFMFLAEFKKKNLSGGFCLNFVMLALGCRALRDVSAQHTINSELLTLCQWCEMVHTLPVS